MTHLQAGAIVIGGLGLLLGGSTFLAVFNRNGNAFAVLRDRVNALICMAGALAIYVVPREAAFLAVFAGWVGANVLMFWLHARRENAVAGGLR